MTEPTDAELITRLNEPEYYHAGNFDTPQRAIALLLGLCQEAADALKKQGRPAQAADSVQEDAARYRYLRDGDWREHEKLESVIRLQLNALWDETIDAARKQGAMTDACKIKVIKPDTGEVVKRPRS